jgi:hypothetical protein
MVAGSMTPGQRKDLMTFSRLAARLLALLFLLSPVAGPARAADPIVIKFSHIVAPDTPKGMTADKFKELAEAMSSRSSICPFCSRITTPSIR